MTITKRDQGPVPTLLGGARRPRYVAALPRAPMQAGG